MPRRFTSLGAGVLAVMAIGATTAHAAVDYGPARYLSEKGEEGLRPQVVVDSAGTATVAWYGSNGTDIRVKARRIAADGTRGPVMTLSRPGTSAAYPRMAIDPQGRVWVVWHIAEQGAISQVEAVRLAADGKPGEVITLSQPTENSFYPQVAIDSRGVATFVWQTERTSNRIQVRRVFADGVVGELVTLDDDAFIVRDPQIAIDSADRATVVWSRQDGDPLDNGFRNGTIRAVQLAADGTPGPARVLSPPNDDSFRPQVAVDPLGRATVVWTTINGLVSSRLAEDGTVSPPLVLSGPDGAIDAAALAVDALGRALVAWNPADGANLHLLRLGADRVPEPVASFAAAGITTRSGPALAVDSQNRATLVWAGFDNGNERALAVRMESDGTLSRISRVSGAGDITDVQDIAVGPGDALTIAWSRDVGSTGARAEFASGGPGTRPPDAQIFRGPRGTTHDRTPGFTLFADVIGAKLECKLDRGKFGPCEPQFNPTVRFGRHRLLVRARDADGVDPTPASRSFRVTPRRRSR